MQVGNIILTLPILSNAKEVLLQFVGSAGGRCVSQMKFDFVGEPKQQVKIYTYDPGNTDFRTYTGGSVDTSTGEIRAGFFGGNWGLTQALIGVYYR